MVGKWVLVVAGLSGLDKFLAEKEEGWSGGLVAGRRASALPQNTGGNRAFPSACLSCLKPIPPASLVLYIPLAWLCSNRKRGHRTQACTVQ